MKTAPIVPLVLASVLALSACATPSAPQPGPSATPAASASEEPAAGVPGSRLDGTCSDLLSLVDAAGVVGANASAIDRDASLLLRVAADQGGLTECSWSGDSGRAGAAILPEADQLHIDSVAANTAQGYPATTVLTSPVGQSETSFCWSDDPTAFCQSSFAVDGYWVVVYHEGDRGGSVLSPPLTALAQSVESALGDLVEPLPAFEAPVMRDATEACPADLDPSGAVLAASGVTGYGPTNEDSGDGLLISYTAMEHAGLLACSWRGESDIFYRFDVYAVPGASWAWSEVKAARENAQAVTVPGATEAIATCDGNECIIDVLIDQSWVLASYGDLEPTVDEALAAVTAALPLVTATFTPED